MSDLAPIDIIEPLVEKVHPIGSGVQKLFGFPNGYGASVVRFEIMPGVGSHGAAEGRWELAVIKHDANAPHGFELTYDTPIADDVIGYLDDAEVQDYLRRIRALPHRDEAPVRATAAIEGGCAMTEPTQALAARRREIVRAVADLSEKHDLPMPMQIDVTGNSSIYLRMDNDDRDAVARWTEVTGNGAVTDSEPMDAGHRMFVTVKSATWSYAGPTWMDAYHFDIWSACDAPEGGAE